MTKWPTLKTLMTVAGVAAVLLVATGRSSYSRLPSQSRLSPRSVGVAPAFARSPAPHARVVRAASVPSVPAADLTEVVQRYCAVCHNPTVNTGNLSLKDFDVDA